MKLYRAHDGLSLSLPAPPAATSSLDDLLDCLSLATGIQTDNIICMTADGTQLHPDNYRILLSLDPPDLEFFIYNREYLYTDPKQLALQLAVQTHLEQPLSHIDELPEPGTPYYASAVLPWALHALSLIRTHASRAHLAHTALSNMHRASAIALANLLQYTRTIAAGAHALDTSVGAELTRMKDLLDSYERDLNLLGMVPINPRLLNPSSSRDSTSAQGANAAATAVAAGGKPSSASPASTPSSHGHGMSSAAPAIPTKRLGDYVQRQRMSAVAAACARVHAELATRFVKIHHHLHALQTDVNSLESEVNAVDLGAASDEAQTAREARQRAEDIVERGLGPWLSGNLAENEEEHRHLIEQGYLPPFPLGPKPAEGGQQDNPEAAASNMLIEYDQDRLHSQLEEALTELVLLDEVTRASVLRLSQDRNDMQARIITFLQDISAVQSDLGELAEAMDVFEKEEMPPGAGVRQAVQAQRFAQAQARAQNQVKLAHNFSPAFVLDGFRPSMAPVAVAAAGAGAGIGAAPPPSSSSTTQPGQPIRADGFRHLARLHHMLLAYGATLIELVRRATFSRLFLKSAQSVAELMALVSEREVERRKEWRKAGVSSMLPWDVRALSLVPMSGSAAGGGNMGASAFGDEGTPMLEISTKGMALLHAASGAGSSGFDPLSAALASAAELGRDDVDKLFTLLDDIERALEQEADLARESEVAVSLRRQSSALRQHGAAAAGGFALPHQGQRSPATPPHAFQSPASQGLPLPPVNPIPEVRAALRMLVDEIDDMEPEFKDLVNVTLLERRSRFRRRHSTRRTATQGESGAEGEEEQGSEADDVDSDEEDEAELGSVLNGGNRQARTQGPRASRRALRQQLKELTARIEEAEGAASSAQVSLEAAQTENARLRSDLAHLSEEHHHAYGAIRLELENVRAESRSNAEAYDRARHSRDDALAQIDTLRNDVDTEAARRLNLEEEITNVRKDMKEARREEVEAKREALELEERLAELDVQTSELQNELENAVKAREDVCNRMEGLLKEGSSAEQELASAQTRIEELNRETSAARTEVREAKEALAEAESARDKLIRTYRAEADGDRAILEENVRNKEQELRLAKEGLKNADTARKAAEAREAAERTVSDGLRGQLEAADVTHESMLRDLEEAREDGSKLETRLRDAMDERDELLRLVRPVMGKIQALRKIIKAMPVPQSSSSKSTAEKEGKTGSGSGGAESTAHERASSATSAASEPVNGSSSHGAGSAVTVKGSNGNGVLNAALEAFENEGENDASLATTLSALRALEPRHFHDEVKGKLDSLTTLVRKWQKAYKGTGEKISRAQSSARDRIAYRNFEVGDLVLFLPTRNTSARTFAAFNRGFPHYFLRAEGSFGEQIRNKDYLLDRITAVTERVAGPAPAGGAGDVSADGTNPYQLTEGVRYHILDVEGALNNGGSSLSSAPQTPKRMGGMPPRSVSHGPSSRRDSSVTTASSATSVISPPAPLLPASIPASSHAATLSTSVNAPSGLTLSRSTSRSFDRLASTLAESEQGVGATGGSSTATITALNSFGGGLSPSEVGSSASIPVPAFGTRARAGLKRRAPGDGSGEVGVGSTGVSPGSGGPTSIVPAVPMPISMPRGGSGNSSLDNNGEHHLQRLPYNRATGSSGGGMGPTVAELERGLKNPATSRAIAEALAAEGLQSIGNPFSASPGGAGSLVERRPSFGGRASIPNSSVSSRGGLSATGTATTTVASPLRANAAASAARRREGSSSSSSNVSNVSNLSRARREGGAFRRPGAGSSGMATPTRAGFYPSRGQIGRVGSAMDTSPSAASPALAVESLATARGETSLLAVASGGRADGGFWRTESQSPGLEGIGSPRLSADAGPSWARSNMASPSPSPATRMQRQLSSEGGSGFSSDLLSPMPTPGRGMLGLVGTRPSNSSDVSQTSDVAFPRTRSHTGGGGGTSIISNTNRNSLPASRKDSFSSGFLSSLTFGRASARKQSLQGPQSRLLAAEGEDGGRMSAAATAGQTTGPRRSTLEMILGWPGSSSGTAMPPATTATTSGKGKGKRAVRGSVSEGGPLGVEGTGVGEGEMSALEVGSPGSEAGSATAAEMLRRLARTTS
ncbi:hypothetical protein A4X09_0g2483 [Tilletia walkeri]|uniref:Autophagy-related protein 11 n=1 Tax=Tilletia walkeri TaxID=117179 RepID=A0A8X7ND85_9BASI|nr:hypothetical protein A4X09_0g2483 [Tilletia walkeri]